MNEKPPCARVLALLASLLLVGACCPPKRVDYSTPEATLRTWQAQLCHDDPIEEYGCLTAGLKLQMGGWETYYAARRKLLEEQPFFAWLLKTFDLPGRAVETLVLEDAGVARMTFEVEGQEYDIAFERETWAIFDTQDDPSPTARLERPIADVVYQRGGQQVLRVDEPLLSSEQIRRLRAIRVLTRWKIGSISGLLTPAEVTP
ncbi:MAG: hypothetical protein H6825_10520 [Planctomycetes bacterium]|nr:hypothetical protein [Planctomycetota bacterium]